MAGAISTLFPSQPDDAHHGTGVLPSQTIRALIRDKEIEAVVDIDDDQVQPASLDLRLGQVAYRVRASFMPGAGAKVMDKIAALGMHEIDIRQGAVLEKDCVYIVPLMEQLRLGSKLSAFANPKSSTGRLDIFTRLMTDEATEFDRVRRGYRGPLYIEIAPRTFSIVVRQGSRLNQLRMRRGSASTSKLALQRLHDEIPLVDSPPGDETIREDSIGVSLDLKGDPESGLVGFRAKKHADVIDVDRRGHYDPHDFWEPIYHRPGQGIILDPDAFYILATKEAVTVPPTHAAEMIAYDTLVGEFRVHYAGFFDPGFGYDPEGKGAAGSKAVLEVRSHDVPFMLEHEQIVGWLRYDRLTSVPDKLYGQGIGSSYQGQALRLGKQFKPLT